jgi:hypothetical protein
MGIHHTYKSQRGERAERKQAKQDALQEKSNARKARKKSEEQNDTIVVPENQIITLDFLTNPENK